MKKCFLSGFVFLFSFICNGQFIVTDSVTLRDVNSAGEVACLDKYGMLVINLDRKKKELKYTLKHFGEKLAVTEFKFSAPKSALLQSGLHFNNRYLNRIYFNFMHKNVIYAKVYNGRTKELDSVSVNCPNSSFSPTQVIWCTNYCIANNCFSGERWIMRRNGGGADKISIEDEFKYDTNFGYVQNADEMFIVLPTKKRKDFGGRLILYDSTGIEKFNIRFPTDSFRFPLNGNVFKENDSTYFISGSYLHRKTNYSKNEVSYGDYNVSNNGTYIAKIVSGKFEFVKYLSHLSNSGFHSKNDKEEDVNFFTLNGPVLKNNGNLIFSSETFSKNFQFTSAAPGASATISSYMYQSILFLEVDRSGNVVWKGALPIAIVDDRYYLLGNYYPEETNEELFFSYINGTTLWWESLNRVTHKISVLKSKLEFTEFDPSNPDGGVNGVFPFGGNQYFVYWRMEKDRGFPGWGIKLIKRNE